MRQMSVNIVGTHKQAHSAWADDTVMSFILTKHNLAHNTSKNNKPFYV
jgi:hypothetical protein